MAYRSRFRLPHGLPACLVSHDSGFPALCRLLQVETRAQKQSLVNRTDFKRILKDRGTTATRDLKTADRLQHQITDIYSLPSVRRKVWEAWFNRTEGFQNPVDGLAPPSLEYQALRQYHPTFHKADIDDQMLSECASFYQADGDQPEWCSPALALLPLAHADLRNWGALEDERRQSTVLAAFAIATLLDDARLLHWATERDESLAAEFQFAKEEREAGTERSRDSVEDAGLDGESTSDDDPATALRNVCKRLSEAARELGDSFPSSVLFDQVGHWAAAVAQLREPVLRAAEAQGVEAQITAHEDFLRSQSEIASWVAAGIDDIGHRWRQAYPVSDAETVSALGTDIERSQRATTEHLEKWVQAAAQASESRSVLEAANRLLEEAKDNLAVQMSAQKERNLHTAALASAQSLETEAQQDVLDAASPLGKYNAYQSAATESASGSAPSGLDSALNEERGVAQSTPTNAPDAGTPIGAEEPPRPEPATASPPPESAVSGAVNTEGEGVAVAVATDGREDASKPKAARTVSDAHEDIMWRSLRNGRGGVAYQIARIMAEVGATDQSYPASDLIACVVLGRAISGPENRAAQSFGGHAEAVLGALPFKADDPDTKDALNLLLFSGAVRPALFAPMTGAISMLQGVEMSSGDLAPVFRLTRAITPHTRNLQRLHLDLGQVSAILEGAVWEDRLESHVREVEAWRAAAESQEFLYKPAAMVWRYWMQNNDGILFDLARLIAGSDAQQVSQVEEIVDVLSVDKKLSHVIDDTLRNKLNLKRAGRITGRGRAQIDGNVARAASLARSWLRIIESKPGSEQYVEGRVADLRADIKRFAPEALDAIAEMRERTPGPALSAALVWAYDQVNEIATIFGHDREASYPDAAEAFEGVLSEDLVYVTDVDLGPDGRVAEGADPHDILNLLIDTDAHAETIDQAFDARLRRGDLAGAQAALEMMARGEHPREEACRDELDRILADQRPTLERELVALNQKLEQAYTGGELSEDASEEEEEEDAVRLKALIIEARRLLAEKTSVIEAVRIVSGFRGVIETRFARVVDRVGAEIEPLLQDVPEEPRQFIEDARAEGDLITLYEVLEMLKNSESVLPGERARHLAVGTRLAALTALDHTLDQPDAPALHELVSAAASGEDIVGLNFSALSASEAGRARERLDLWCELARGRKASPEQVSELLESIGFAVLRCVLRAEGLFSVNVEPLRGREFCPVPTYGSDAAGRYEIVLNWRTPALNGILQAVPDAITQCVLVFHFGRLSGDERERLRKTSIRNRRRFLTVDENLMLYLSAMRGATLRTFFDCTLPFSAIQPYFTAAGLVPPESFYGREEEREKLEDPRGSCFVYGGRQLGKTALLRSVEASFHKPEAGQIAKWIDLKAHDIGVAHGAEAIWKALWDTFVDLEVIDPSVRTRPTRPSADWLVETVSNEVYRWVSEGDRRVLLLLDEADGFLVSDVKNDFQESTRLKGLMDRTDRGFKVVFSGLHNVVRTTTRANHPLAHFGEPVCVGPLRSNGELQEVRAMIREPLAAAGGELSAENLSVHIQAGTNYYPSLIQLYGASLVEYLRNTPERPFPYAVNLDDIQAVFERNKLRETIRERFDLTLQLDPRYEVIAYAMAFEFQGAEGERISDGILGRTIQQYATGWWEDGFDIPDKEFDTLLEEMEGLGVLRKRKADDSGRPRYTFRNPNILLLLGDSEKIEATLESGEREVPGTFEQAEFHARYPSQHEVARPRRRGPLSYEQESLLLRRGGLAVIAGVKAANIESVGEFLSQRIEPKRFQDLDVHISESDLLSQLKSRRPGHGSVHVYLLPKEVVLNVRWIEAVARWLKGVERGRYMRVVFQADPNDLWNFVSDLDCDYLEDDNGLFDWIGVQPWSYAFLRQWCMDLDLPPAPSHVKALLADSGGWPSVLVEHYARPQGKSPRERREGLVEYISEQRERVLDDLGLGSPQAQRSIDALRYFSAYTPEEAAEIVSALDGEGDPGLTSHALVRRLWWARRLGLIQDVQGAKELNVLVEKTLPKSFP